MKSMGRRHALLALGVMLGGCTPEPPFVTQSNMAASAAGQKLKRVLIAIHVRNPSMLQVAELQRAFEAKWPPLGIAIDVVDLDDAPASGGPPLAAAHARFRPAQLLLLQLSRSETRGLYIRHYEIDARIYESSSRTLIWRGATELTNFWNSSHVPSKRPEAADRYVDSLTATLKRDGLV